jgi:hypothetical protein
MLSHTLIWVVLAFTVPSSLTMIGSQPQSRGPRDHAAMAGGRTHGMPGVQGIHTAAVWLMRRASASCWLSSRLLHLGELFSPCWPVKISHLSSMETTTTRHSSRLADIYINFVAMAAVHFLRTACFGLTLSAVKHHVFKPCCCWRCAAPVEPCTLNLTRQEHRCSSEECARTPGDLASVALVHQHTDAIVVLWLWRLVVAGLPAFALVLVAADISSHLLFRHAISRASNWHFERLHFARE